MQTGAKISPVQLSPASVADLSKVIRPVIRASRLPKTAETAVDRLIATAALDEDKWVRLEPTSKGRLLVYVEPANLDTSFLSSPRLMGIALDLVQIGKITTLHPFTNPLDFVPKVEQVLSCIAGTDHLKDTVAFETVLDWGNQPFSLDGGQHKATTTLYRLARR